MKKIIKLLLTIPLMTTPFFLISCTNKDIEKIGKEVGSRVNGENQILIEKLNKIINEQREKINNLQSEINNKEWEIKRKNEEYKKLEKNYWIAQSEKDKEQNQKNEYRKYWAKTQDKEQIHIRELKIKKKK